MSLLQHIVGLLNKTMEDSALVTITLIFEKRDIKLILCIESCSMLVHGNKNMVICKADVSTEDGCMEAYKNRKNVCQ